MEKNLIKGFCEMSQDEMNTIAGGAWEWNEFNEAVIKGSISGAVGGAVAGAAVGGGGAIPGAAWGALGGAVVGGVEYAVDVVW